MEWDGLKIHILMAGYGIMSGRSKNGGGEGRGNPFQSSFAVTQDT